MAPYRKREPKHINKELKLLPLLWGKRFPILIRVSKERTSLIGARMKLNLIRWPHRGRTYIESDRMMSSVPMESADQTAGAEGHASTTMVVLPRSPALAVRSADSMGADDVILSLSTYVLPLWGELLGAT